MKTSQDHRNKWHHLHTDFSDLEAYNAIYSSTSSWSPNTHFYVASCIPWLIHCCTENAGSHILSTQDILFEFPTFNWFTLCLCEISKMATLTFLLMLFFKEYIFKHGNNAFKCALQNVHLFIIGQENCKCKSTNCFRHKQFLFL